MYRFGLIGHQIAYSKSPKIHQQLAKYLNINISYDLLDIKKEALKEIPQLLRKQIYHGFNVTKPYKEVLIHYCDELTEKAKKIKAINTIYYKNQKIIGDNTDYDGFLGLLKQNHLEVKNQKIYILGTGGAAKAIYHVLNDLKAEVKFVSRKKDLKNKLIIDYNELNSVDLKYVINATPIGTYPHIDQMVVSQSFIKDKTVIDLIYNPLQTKLMKSAKKGINGLDMLIIQAIKSMSIWLDQKIDITETLYKQLKDVVINE